MSKFTATILGTTAGMPTKQRGHTAIHISYNDGEETSLLFDCGENTQRQLMVAGLNMMKIDNIFITHWHGDHCLGLPGVVDTLGFEGRKKPLTVYAPESWRVDDCLSFDHSMADFKAVSRDVSYRGMRVRRTFKNKRFDIMTVPVKHSVPAVAYAIIEKDKSCIDLRKAISLGMPESGELYGQLKKKGRVRVGKKKITLKDITMTKKGKKVVYSGDTEICRNLRKLVHGADLLIQDCTYFDEERPEKHYKHASLPEVIDMVQKEGVKKTILTHISRKYQDSDKLKELIKDYPNIELAEDFMKVELQ
ncbi:MAG: MBL fold metallo-hydrolase [Candidatus Omnitrophica bacterium]|nr:MBL fold metallo-hydrolase [Candidatus Omnitrophota bacterium]